MKYKISALLLTLSLVFLLLCGCASEGSPAPGYGCLPSAEEATWETIMNAAISAVADAASRQDVPVDFLTRYHSGGGNWVVTLIYTGGDVYNVNLDSDTARIHTIVKLPADYLDALTAFGQAGTQASQNGELIYSSNG